MAFKTNVTSFNKKNCVFTNVADRKSVWKMIIINLELYFFFHISLCMRAFNSNATQIEIYHNHEMHETLVCVKVKSPKLHHFNPSFFKNLIAHIEWTKHWCFRHSKKQNYLLGFHFHVLIFLLNYDKVCDKFYFCSLCR